MVGCIALLALLAFKGFGSRIADKGRAQASCVAALESCSGGGGESSTAMNGTGSGTSAGNGGAGAGATEPVPNSAGGFWSSTLGRFTWGFVDQGVDTVKTLAVTLGSLTPPGMIYYGTTGQPNPGIEALKGIGTLLLWSTPPMQMVTMMGGPDPIGDAARGIASRIAESWKRDKADFFGRATFEALTVVVPVAKAKLAASAAKTARAAALEKELAEAARLEKIAAAERAAEAERVATAARAAELAAREAAAAERFRNALAKVGDKTAKQTTVDVLELVPVKDPVAMRRLTVELPEGYATRMVSAHANPGGVYQGGWVGGEWVGSNTPLTAAELHTMLGAAKEGEVIVFRSCLLGQGGEGAAMMQELANMRNATVIAPKIYSTFIVASERADDFLVVVPRLP